MNPQNYHKVYMNHVQSSTLLAQLATMWKSQTLCDAIIKTGSISTRAHRVVLVAACPMLQTMENATSGSHLEVRLASDIAQESVNTFLQYLYEGFMILTEDNCSDVEKIARLLQVDSVTKCCADFQKCLNRSAGSQFKYSFQEQTEFKHVRVSDLFKKQERSTKRAGDLHRPPSPGSKRQRLHRPSSPKIHDTSSMAESYGATSDPWERVPRLGSGFQGPGVIDIREDGFELVQTEPPKKDITGNQEPRKVQTSVSLSVSSQHNTSSDLRVVNVTGDSAPPVPHPVSKPPSAPPPITNMSGSSRDPITVSPITFHDSPSSSSSSVEISRSMPQSDKTSSKKEVDKQPQPTIHIPDYSDPQFSDINTNIVSRSDDNVSSTQYKSPYPVAMSQVSRPVPVGPPKPFASGSASQSESSPAFSDPVQSPGNQRPQATKERSDSLERPPSTGKAQDTGQGRPDDKDIDLSIVKVESAGQRDIENLQMYMSEGGMTMNVQAHRSEEDDPDPNNSFDLEEPPGEWSRDEMSNEGSNISGGDQSGNWYMGQFKETRRFSFPSAAPLALLHNMYSRTHADSTAEYMKDSVVSGINSNHDDGVRNDQDNLPRYNPSHPALMQQGPRFHGFRARPRQFNPKIFGKKAKSDFDEMERAGLKHRLVRMADGKDTRNCKVCELVGNRTGTRTVRSYYMCEACGICLCRPQMRNCFMQYHAMIGYFGPLGQNNNDSEMQSEQSTEEKLTKQEEYNGNICN